MSQQERDVLRVLGPVVVAEASRSTVCVLRGPEHDFSAAGKVSESGTDAVRSRLRRVGFVAFATVG